MAENIPARPLRNAATAASASEAPPKTPSHLSAASKALFRAIVEKWILGPDGLAIFIGGLEHRDAYEVCRAQVQKDGPTFRLENGQIKVHPAARLSIEHFAAFRQAMRQIGLDPEK